ncbi:MAG: hypothetical protein ACLUIX_05105 [Oscillospiraceae bacterium]
MSDYYDQTPEQRRQLRAQRNRRRQAQVRRRKLLLGLLVLAVLAVVLILVLRGCGKDKEPAQPTPSENVDKPDTPNTRRSLRIESRTRSLTTSRATGSRRSRGI